MSADNKHRGLSADWGGRFPMNVLWQLLALIGLSCALGFTFNAASPVGVRFGELAAIPTPIKTKVATNPAPALPPLPTNPVVVASLPPAPINVTTTTPQPRPRPAAPIFKPPPAATPWSVSVVPPSTNPGAAVVAVAPSQPPNPTPIHWTEAKGLVAAHQAILVDVRHKAMFDAGHIPGATSLPESSPPEEFKAFLDRQATNLTVIVYCSSTTCSQSARVANRLVNEFHWSAVRFMTGGYQEYQQLELARPTPPSP